MKNIYITIFTFFFSSSLLAQSLTYSSAIGFGGSGSDDGKDIAVDQSSNIYIAGGFRDTVDFDPGSSTEQLISNGFEDMFIQKLDPQSNLIWVKQMGGTKFDNMEAIAVNSNMEVYSVGSYRDTVDFDPGVGVLNLYGSSMESGFIQKLDSNGDLLWAKGIFSNSQSSIKDIEIDNAGNSYTTGQFVGTQDFDLGSGTAILTSSGSTDFFLQKRDNNGNLLWLKQIGGTGSDWGETISIDDNGNIVIGGHFSDVVDFDPGNSGTTLTSAGDYEAFVMKLDPNGNFLWAKQFAGANREFVNAVDFDDQGNLYVVGNFDGTVDFDPSNNINNLVSGPHRGDAFVVKLDGNGNLIWAQQMHQDGGSSGAGGNDFEDVKVSENGRVYCFGQFFDTVSVNTGTGLEFFYSNGDFDLMMLELTTNGDYVSTTQYGSSKRDFGYALELDYQMNIYATGQFWETIDFDGTNSLGELTSNGNSDAFILKLDLITSSISESDAYHPFVVFPNPNNGKFSIDFGTDEIDKVEVWNVSGEIVKTVLHPHSMTTDFSLKPGVYILRVKSSEKYSSYRIVVQ